MKKSKCGREIEIRKAIKSDASELIKYLNTIGGESKNLTFGKDEFKFTVEQEKEYLENLSNETNSIMILAIFEGEIIGQGTIISDNRKRLSHNSILGISVKKDFWSDGIGTIIMEELMNFVNSCERIINVRLSVNYDNKNAIKLYKKFHFTEIGLHHKAYCIDNKFYDELDMDFYK